MTRLCTLISALAVPVPAAALQAAGHQTVGYVWMFLLMASMPYVLLALIGGGIYRALKRQRERDVERALAEQDRWEASRDGR